MEENTESSTYIDEVSKRHKLDDVPDRVLAGGGLEHAVVSVQDVHGGEVGRAHTHNDNGHGQLGRVDDGRARTVHVGDDAVRQDKQHEVVLYIGRKAKVYSIVG